MLESDLDFESLKSDAYLNGSRRAKREAIKQGFTEQLSLYGAVSTAEGEAQGRRIEVLSDRPWDSESLRFVYGLMSRIVPPFRYSIWTFSIPSKKLSFRWGA